MADLAVDLFRASPNRGDADAFDRDPDAWLLIVLHRCMTDEKVFTVRAAPLLLLFVHPKVNSPLPVNASEFAC